VNTAVTVTYTLLVFSTVLCLLTNVTSAPAVMTSPTRWMTPCSGSNDVTGTSRGVTVDVTGTPTSSNDDMASTFRQLSVKMKRLKSRVRELKNIYVSRAFILRGEICWSHDRLYKTRHGNFLPACVHRFRLKLLHRSVQLRTL